MTTTTTPKLHIYFVLDRSGSMNSMVDDVIGGFNGFVNAQQADGADAVMTLIQFDGQDSHEVLADAVSIAKMEPLTAATFCPRGNTPLYDAMGHVLADATIRSERRRDEKKAEENVLFVTFTDGGENASREYTHTQIFDLVQRREQDGWMFAYLGANQDAYDEAERFGVSEGSIQNFAGDGEGSTVAFMSLSDATINKRAKIRNSVQHDNTDFFEGNKHAEQDLKKRKTRRSY
ncbi:MAG: vWA domain-containing protein [Actinomycetes bacterium]